MTRKDVVIHRDNIDVVKALGDYGYVMFAGPKTDYVFSGGIRGSWQDNALTKEIFNPLYKISDEASMANDTLVNILSLQGYLKSNNIPYIMSSYMNYWSDQDRVGDLDYGIGKYPEFGYLVDQIDFSRWLFVNENRDCIYELAKSTPNGLQDDMFHPSFDVHKLWADKLFDKLLKDGFFNRPPGYFARTT